MAATLTAAPLGPLGYDSGLALDCDYPLLEDLDFDQAMREQSWENEMLWRASPPGTLSSRSDAGTSPSQHTHPPSAQGSSSLSPSGASLILTPTSTLLDYTEVIANGDPDSEEPVSSPESNLSPTDDFVMVPRFGGESSAAHSTRIPRPPPHISGAISSARPSHPSHEPSLSHTQHLARTTPAASWGAVASPASGTWMAHHHTSQQQQEAAYTESTNVDFINTYAPNGLFSNVEQFAGAQYLHGNIPFRSVDPSQNFNAFDQVQNGTSVYDSPATTQSLNSMSLYPSAGGLHRTSNQFSAADFAYSGSQPMRPQHQQHLYPSVSAPQIPASVSSASSSTITPIHSTAAAQHDHRLAQEHAFHSFPPAGHRPSLPSETALPLASASGPSRAQQRLLIKDETRPGGHGPIRSTPGERAARRGGRIKNSHLPEQSRQKSSEMRKVGACWRCALQRDPCDHGDPCSRCMMRLQKGQAYYFDCDRSKLPDFVHDFLPPSMTLMHQKQSIEDCVKDQVHSWDHQNGLDIYLSSGYGPALRWKLYEFTPWSEDLLNQLQYFQDTATGQVERRFKYSPPYGLMKIDTSDDAHFEAYLDRLLDPQYLRDFGRSCYEEETLVDRQAFQARLLHLMCKLYLETEDDNLKLLLRDILRMMIITYIMGHTLTISQETLWSVVSNVRHTRHPDTIQPHTSPRLANRQLKFFFAVLRMNIYEKILKWQQATLHMAGKKELTWLPTFCVMLSFAMVLEEIQRTIHIQADAKGARGELSPENAEKEAENACERIDGRFKLLVGLFQCKYRDKKWGDRGSFGPGTPELSDPAAKSFLRTLRNLVKERADHLRSRENVTFSSANQALYTTRLTARFLLPFLNLPS